MSNDAFGAAISEAFEEATKEATVETAKPDPIETVTEDKATEAEANEAPEAKDTKATASAAEKLADEDLSLTAEEMDAISKNPQLAKIYKSMQRGLTQKTMGLAEERRQIAQRDAILKQIEEDPEQAAYALAKTAGLEISKPRGGERQMEAVDEALGKMAEIFGPEAANVLKPVFEQLINGVIESEIAPLKQHYEASKAQSFDQQMGAAVEQFKASVGDDITPEIEQEMVALMAQIKPGKDVTPTQYLKFLHTNVTAGKARVKATQDAADRIRKASEKQEPVAGIRAAREPETGISTKKSFSENFSSAFDESLKEIGRR